jgi:hypothetical protein
VRDGRNADNGVGLVGCWSICCEGAHVLQDTRMVIRWA